MIGYGFVTAGETPNAPDRHRGFSDHSGGDTRAHWLRHARATIRHEHGFTSIASPTWDAARLLSD
jgi:hypothetical protein